MAEGIVDLSPNRNDKPDNNVQKSVQVTPQPIPYEFHKKEGRRWPVLLVYFLLALIVSTGIVFAGRWAYREVSNNPPSSKPAPAQANKNVKKAPAAPKESSSNSAGQTPGSSGAGNSTPATNNPPAVSPTTGDSTTQLPNTGG